MRVKYVASVFFLILGILGLSSLCYGQGKAIYFDGTGDYIDLGSNQTQDGMDGATGLTLETWVNPSSLRSGSDRNVVADFCLNGSYSMAMMYFTNSGRFRFGGRSTSTDAFEAILTTNAIVSTGNWYHMAGVLDFTNKTVRIYQNGELIGSRTGVSFGSNTYVSTAGSNEYIGANQSLANTQFFHGYLDDMRIWNTPRTQEQIQDDMTVTISSQSNLLGYWKFDDDADDSSGNGYDGALAGNAAYSSSCFHFGKYYRSIDTGTWRNIANWEVSLDNSDWISATVYPIAGVNANIRTGDEITLGADATCKNLLMSGGDLDIDAYGLTIPGTLTETSGTISGSPSIDGYSSNANKYLAIATNDIMIDGFSTSTELESTMPSKVDRKWTVNGSFSGNKSVTFYWDADDDNNFSWNTVDPSVYKGATEYIATAFSVNTNPRWVTVTLPSFDDKGSYKVGAADDETLPVELSSFTAGMSAQNYVMLQWITQSETNVVGYRIFRNTESDLESAQMLNAFVDATNTSTMQVYVFWDEEVSTDGTYYYWLQNLDFSGESAFHGPVSISVVLDDHGTPAIPVVQGITNAYPNPFNPTTTIEFGVLRAGNVAVAVYNTRGQLVRNLYTGLREKGTYFLTWDGTDANNRALASGIYYIRMDMNGQRFSRKVMLMK